MMTAHDDITAGALAEINRRAAIAAAREPEDDVAPDEEHGARPSENPGLTWYVAVTNSQSERKAAWKLRRKRVASYFPRLVREVPIKGKPGQKEVKVTPLFPKYLFVGLDHDAGQGLWCLSGVSGVESVVRVAGMPVTLSFAVLAQLQRLEANGAFDMRKKAVAARLKEGQSVEITSGPFVGLVGQVAKAKPGKRVEVLLTILGGLTTTRINDADLRAVE